MKKIIQKELETCGTEEKYWLEYAIETHGMEHVAKRIEERKEARKKAQETRDCERKLLRSDSLAINIKHRTPLCGSYLIYSLIRNLPLDLQLAILGEFEKADKLLKAKPTDKEKKDLQDKLKEQSFLLTEKQNAIAHQAKLFQYYVRIIGIAVLLLILMMWV